MHIYPTNLIQQLDFHQITQHLEGFCYGKKAKAMAVGLKPGTGFEKVQRQLQETNEFLLSLYRGDGIPVSSYPELDNELHLLSIQNAVLSAGQIHQMRNLVKLANELILFFKDHAEIFPFLKQRTSHLSYETRVIEFIDQIIDADSIIRDEASELLLSIRKELQENRKHCDRIYRAHIQRLRKLDFLADFDESYVSGRRVLCVLAEHKREVKGIILGQSASGKITYIEPQNVIQLNNDRIQMEEDEQKETYRILQELTEILQPYRSIFLDHYKLLSEMDFIAAKAKLARELQATLPILTQGEQKIHLVNAFHPVLFLQNVQQKLPTVPIHCTLDQQRRIMVISGPNAGGKSITLKTIGLLQIMLQCGLLIPASAKSEISLKKNIFGDIGDHQSIEDGLSTYSSRLLKMKYFLERTDRDTLFLIDEFGTGSDPDMGGAMAEIILNKLNGLGAQGVVTTHFTNLKLLANHEEGIFNACMLFNNKSLKPLYQLHVGEPGSSFTFEVAEKIGLPAGIIQEAKEKLSNEKVKMDRLLNQLQHEKNVIIKLKKDLQKQMSKTTAEKREFKELNDQLEDHLLKNKEQKEEKQKLMDYGRKLHQLTQEWVVNKNKKEVIHKFVKLAGWEQVKKKEQEDLEKSEAYRIQKLARMKAVISIGSQVRMMKSKEVGTIREIKANRAKVVFGNVEMNVGLEKLEPA